MLADQPASSPVVSVPRSLARRLRSAVLWFCGFVVLLTAFCFICRAPLLRGTATAWIIDDSVAHADAIVVLGGGLDYRPFAAARLYTNGCAKTILVTQPEVSKGAQGGRAVPEFILARDILLRNGVPDTAIEPLGTNVTSTRDEAFALKSWAAGHHARSFVIPTDIFHTRRVRWIFQKALRGSDAEIHVVALTPHRYAKDNWWQTEDGLITFQNEVVKSLYYHLKY